MNKELDNLLTGFVLLIFIVILIFLTSMSMNNFDNEHYLMGFIFGLPVLILIGWLLGIIVNNDLK